MKTFAITAAAVLIGMLAAQILIAKTPVGRLAR